MESISFLTIDDESISLGEAMQYLRRDGSLSRVMGNIIQQHLVEKELRSRPDIQIEPSLVDRALEQFRQQRQLMEGDRFEQWLKANGFSFESFQNQIAFGLKIEKLKVEVTESQLEQYFTARKPFLDRVILSRIIVKDKILADNLKQEILADRNKFGALAKQHSITEERVMGGMMGSIQHNTLPEQLKTAIQVVQPGELIGPLEIDGLYCLFRIEQFQDAVLQGKLKQNLRNQLFQQYLQQKLQNKKIKLQVN